MQAFEQVRTAFVDPQEFWSSPLYRRLSADVAADDFLVRVAANARAGQVPTFAFFGAVHATLLADEGHALARYYLSVDGADACAPDEDAGAALRDFVATHLDAIVTTLQTRLVQTNHVQRAVALRLGLVSVRTELGPIPVHLLEVGASAGLLLRHDRYAYRLGHRTAGERASAVHLDCEWRSDEPPPDLDAIPPIASTVGIDLNPLDPNSSVGPSVARGARLARGPRESRLAGGGSRHCPVGAGRRSRRRRHRPVPAVGRATPAGPTAGRAALRDPDACSG